MIYSMELSIIGLTFLGLGVAGFVVYRMVKHVDNRIHLMIRASYQNTRNIRENIEMVDVVRSETRKALEHQRMLLSSLNQQLKSIESTIAESDPKGPEIPVERVKLSQAMAEKEGLLGSLDEYIDDDIEQSVANDDQPKTKTRTARKKKAEVRSKQVGKDDKKDKSKQDVAMDKALEHQRNLLGSLNEQIESLEATVAEEGEPQRPTVAESQLAKLSEAIARKEGLLNEMSDFDDYEEVASTPAEERLEEQTLSVAKEIPVEAAKPVTKATVGKKAKRIISMRKLLLEEKQRASAQAEKTEKIVKLASMFAKRESSAAVSASENLGAEKTRKRSVG